MKIGKNINAIEYAALGLSSIGTIAAIATQQIAYVAAPLTLSCSLSLLNQRRQSAQIDRQIDLALTEIKSTLPTIEKYSNAELNDRIALYLEQNTQILNLTLENYAPKYIYELVLGREQSRQTLIQALDSAEDRLILVCPWICHHGFDNTICEKLEKLLSDRVTVEIGYGKRDDLEYGKLKGKFYNRIKQLKDLESRHPNLKLKLIGTHEKYLVCDRSFAMLGSHNFLTSGIGEEREIGLKTTDSNLIDALIVRYDLAPSLEPAYILN